MNIQRRLEKLETQIKATNVGHKTVDQVLAELRENVRQKQANCKHPPSVAHFRRCQPYPRIDGYKYSDVIKIHCDHCAYDAPLFNVANMTPEKMEQFCESVAEHERYENPVAQQIVREGFMDYTPWPPCEETKAFLQGKVSNRL